MRGTDHGLASAAMWLGVAPVLPAWLQRLQEALARLHADRSSGAFRGHLGATVAAQVGRVHLAPVTTLQLFVGLVLVAGAGLLPDWDHPDASAAHTFPGGPGVAKVVETGTGGHRHGTHSIPAIAAAGAAGWWCGGHGPGRAWAAWALAFMLAALTLHIIPWSTLKREWCKAAGRAHLPGVTIPRIVFARMSHRALSLAVAAGIATLLTLELPYGRWLGVICAVGVASHCLADQFNPEGWQPAWPISRFRLRTPLFETDSPTEDVASVVLVAGDLFLAVWRI